MSASQAMAQAAPQIHPLAELREALFQAGMLRQRNLQLAHENYQLQQRVQELQAEQRVAAERVDLNSGD